MTGKWKPERNADVLRRAIAGESYASIGKRWGIGRKAVSFIARDQAKRAGIDLPKRPTSRPESAKRGSAHYAWKGDAARTETKRERCRTMYPLGPCERCGKPGTDRHHKDADTGNNSPENIAVLCRRCHMEEDGRLEKLRVLRPPRKQLGVCVNCGCVAVRRKGRCHACNEYFRRRGFDRTT